MFRECSAYFKTCPHLFSVLWAVHEQIGTNIGKSGPKKWKSVKGVCRVSGPNFSNKNIKEYDAKNRSKVCWGYMGENSTFLIESWKWPYIRITVHPYFRLICFYFNNCFTTSLLELVLLVYKPCDWTKLLMDTAQLRALDNAYRGYDLGFSTCFE